MGNSLKMFNAFRNHARNEYANDRGLHGVPATFQLYIGADNTTKRVDFTALREVLDARHDGYTIAPTTGAWKGELEASVVVTISAPSAVVLATAREVATALRQDAVGVVRVGNGMSFVTGQNT
jgi:hypothetical protein